MTNLKTVTLNFAPVNIQVSGNTPAELLENAKKAFVEQISIASLPHVSSYSVGSVNALSFETVFTGQVVENNDGKCGIVTQVNKKTIYVTYPSGVTGSGSPSLFISSDASFEKARYRRTTSEKQVNYWNSGHSGYIKLKTGIKEIVVGKITRGKVKLHIVGTNKYVSVNEADVQLYLKDEKSEI